MISPHTSNPNHLPSLHSLVTTVYGSAATFVESASCNDAMNIANFGYSYSTDGNVFAPYLDVRSLSIAMGVNYGILPLNILQVSARTLLVLFVCAVVVFRVCAAVLDEGVQDTSCSGQLQRLCELSARHPFRVLPLPLFCPLFLPTDSLSLAVAACLEIYAQLHLQQHDLHDGPIFRHALPLHGKHSLRIELHTSKRRRLDGALHADTGINDLAAGVQSLWDKLIATDVLFL